MQRFKDNPMLAVVLIFIGALVIADLSYRYLPSRSAMLGFTPLGKELQLIMQIQTCKSEAERKRLIKKLDKVPVKIYPFHHRWLLINDVQPFHCWGDNGYSPELNAFPRDVQILAATCYGKSDISNGGLHQFYSNGTGIFAPEMIEWFERAGLPEAAAILKESTLVFGDAFPRSQDARNAILSQFEGETRPEWDPFFEMDDSFYESMPYKEHVFDAAADRWLREVCGIQSLEDLP